jgi:selenide,water dikinase
MRTLNSGAADVLRPLAPNAVTDVTGFGLFGHAHEVASRSGVRIELEAGALPALDGALEVAAEGLRTGGDRRNREFAEPHVELDGVPAEIEALGFDPQTAGGLLVSVAAEKGPTLEAEFRARDLFVRRVGRVVAGAGVAVS